MCTMVIYMNTNETTTSKGHTMSKQDRFEQCIASHANNFEKWGGNRTMAMVRCMEHCEAILGRDLKVEETHDLYAAF
jgi:hypothetical protein